MSSALVLNRRSLLTAGLAAALPTPAYCLDARPVYDLELADGFRAQMTADASIVVIAGNGRVTTLAQGPKDWKAPAAAIASACGGAKHSLLGAIDGRYVIYAWASEYWVYGVKEDRTARLSPEPSSVLAW